MAKTYSRLASVEEKRNVKKAFFYVVASMGAVVFLFFWGLPTLIKLAGFLGEIGKSSSTIDISDLTPPAPPQFDYINEYTNSKQVEIAGTAEEGALVKLKINSDSQEAISSSESRFLFELGLTKGENTISATATDSSGNESQTSKVVKVYFDDEKPDLIIESPSNQDSFFGPTQRQIVIKGRTSPDADILINERFVSVNEDGSFTLTTTLSEGENNFEIKANDKAGNEEKSNLTLMYSP